jgi:CDGSH-type Zn-finger protein
MQRPPQIRIQKNGPYQGTGNIPLLPMAIKCDAKGIPARWVIGEKLQTPPAYLLCRCGHSKNKPFCDGAHSKIGFDGTETSKNTPFLEMAKPLDGPALTLLDAETLCASARFCHRGGDIWDVIAKTDQPHWRQNALENACDCPSGRLVIVDKTTGTTVEPKLKQTIGFIFDPAIGGDGPYWVRGGIPLIGSDGRVYEVRNRVTLCRCGKSANKPFCDSSHYPEEDREVKM